MLDVEIAVETVTVGRGQLRVETVVESVLLEIASETVGKCRNGRRNGNSCRNGSFYTLIVALVK